MNKAGVAATAATSTATLLAAIGGAMTFIAPHEGTVFKTYTDPAGYATACSGNRIAAIPGATFSVDECNLLLMADTIGHLIAVRKLVKVPITDEQLIAMTSLAFNVGVGAFAKSTLLAKLNAGDYDGAMAEFRRWVNAGGRQLPGLVIRRAMEAERFGLGIPG